MEVEKTIDWEKRDTSKRRKKILDIQEDTIILTIVSVYRDLGTFPLRLPWINNSKGM